MEFKSIFLKLVALNVLTLLIALLICYIKHIDISNNKIQLKIYFWCTLPYLILMACFADVPLAWKVLMVLVGILSATLMFCFSCMIEKFRKNKSPLNKEDATDQKTVR